MNTLATMHHHPSRAKTRIQCTRTNPTCSSSQRRWCAVKRYKASVVKKPASRCSLRVQAIGFDFGDEDSRDSKPGGTVKSLSSLAASLLLYQSIVKSSVGEAFLNTLNYTIKYQALNRDILAAYGKFYNLLLTSGYESWQDYVLDQIFFGRDNPYARGVAQGTVAQNAPMTAALAYDLDVLQELCLSLSDVARLVVDVAPTAGSYWVEAASSTAAQRPGTAIADSSPQVTVELNTVSQFITRPATKAELEAWKSAISSKESWGNAAKLVYQYYHRHGFGITSRNSALRWSKAAFEEGCEGLSADKLAVLPHLRTVAGACKVLVSPATACTRHHLHDTPVSSPA